jgi:disulfide bond formation protein DsbB
MHLVPHPRARAASTSEPAPAAWAAVFLAWLVAAVSTLGALFLSEVVGVAPCVLCWYQRVFMFPLALVLAVGLFPFDARVLRYAAPLVAGGWLVALYHVLLTAGVIPENLSPCTQGVPCSKVEAVWFGFVTIPLLSLVSFSVIGAALAWARTKVRT